MAITTSSKALASDMADLVSTVNTTLTKYGITNVSNTATSGSLLRANLIRNLVTSLLSADTHSKNTNPNAETTTLNTNNVSVGQLIKAANLTNISTSAINILNRYCSCDCDRCGCNCDRCSCDCNKCGDYCRCGIGADYTCFLPDTFLITSKGPKKVQDIKAGDYILSLNGRFDEIISVWSTDIENETIINYNNDSLNLSLTDAHLIPGRAENKVYYPNLISNNELPLFRSGVHYPELLIENIVLFVVNLLEINKTNLKFKFSQQIIDICKQICNPDTLDILIDKNIMIITGYELLTNYSLSQLFETFIQDDNQIVFPTFIYSLPEYYILKIKEQVDSKIEFNTINQCIQIQFLLNCYGFNYKRNYRHLEFVKKLTDKTNDVNIKHIEHYTGPVYNFSCRYNHIVAGEVLVGDGYLI